MPPLRTGRPSSPATELEARPVILDRQPDQLGCKLQSNRDVRGIRRMLGDVGKRFLRDPVHRFRSCIVRIDTVPVVRNGSERLFPFRAPTDTVRFAERRSQVAAKGEASAFAWRNCPQLMAEPIQQLPKFGERAARGRIGDCLLERGKPKRHPHQVLPGMIMQVARYPQRSCRTACSTAPISNAASPFLATLAAIGLGVSSCNRPDVASSQRRSRRCLASILIAAACSTIEGIGDFDFGGLRRKTPLPDEGLSDRENSSNRPGDRFRLRSRGPVHSAQAFACADNPRPNHCSPHSIETQAYPAQGHSYSSVLNFHPAPSIRRNPFCSSSVRQNHMAKITMQA